MRTFRVNSVLKDKILVSRESAHQLENALSAMMADSRITDEAGQISPVIVDFEGVQGVAPSFLDELLSVLESVIGTHSDGGDRSLIVANPPTRLSLKFQAIARGHEMSVQALPDGSWLLTDARNSCR